MADNRLPKWFTNPQPADDGDAEGANLNDQLKKAAALTIAERSEACALHIRHAARLYLGALRAMGEATLRFDELKGFGLDVGSNPFGPVDSLVTTYQEFARSLVRGGVVSPEDPLVAGVFGMDDPVPDSDLPE